MFRSIVVTFMLLLVGSGAVLAQDAAEERTLYVGPVRVICTGVGPQLCFQVKDEPDADYQLFYSAIDGFEFEPGFQYELLVSVTEVEDPPADAASLAYTLVEQVSKVRTLENNLWQLVSYLNAAGEVVETIADAPITLEFSDQGIGGTAGCNGYFGTFEYEENVINISEVASTLMLCAPDALMNQESVYLAALPTATSFAIEDDQLELMNAAGDVILTFSVREPEPLVGSNWILTSYLVGGDAVAGVLPDVQVTAMFDGEGGVSGSGGCNGYSASYTATDGMISFSPAISTRMACSPESVMGQETAYLTALENIAFYQIHGDVLDLLDANGSTLLSFQAEVMDMQ